MEEKSKLELNFIDHENKNFKLAIDGPREDLSSTEINGAADTILGANVFVQNGQGLRELGNARKIITRTEQVVL